MKIEKELVEGEFIKLIEWTNDAESNQGDMYIDVETGDVWADLRPGNTRDKKESSLRVPLKAIIMRASNGHETTVGEIAEEIHRWCERNSGPQSVHISDIADYLINNAGERLQASVCGNGSNLGAVVSGLDFLRMSRAAAK